MLKNKRKCRFLIVASFVLITIAVISSSFFLINNQHNTTISPQIMNELLDTRHAAIVVPVKSYTMKISIPISALDHTVDRRELLAQLFSRVTAGEPTDQLRVEAWVHYLQDRMVHPTTAPMLNNGQAIYDPYWLLKNQVAQCGQVNRIVVDGLSVAGYKTRVVQLNGHVAAEVWLDGHWGFLDADYLDLGQFVHRKDGSLASAEEIHENPNLLNGLKPMEEFKLYPYLKDVPSLDKRLAIYKRVFINKPYYCYKTATLEEEKNEYFGWNDYKTVYE